VRSLLAIFLVVGLGFGFLGLQTPEPLPADAPPVAFSAERALADVAALAAAPREPGTAAHASARAYLDRRLRELGFHTEVQRATVAGREVLNLVARRRAGAEGLLGPADARRALLLCAHYDTVPGSPGAGDDALGCAVVLEVARALLASGEPVRDLMVLISDGEELGLLGARAFVRGGDDASPHPWAKDVGVVLVFEARGNRGPAWCFQSGPGNADLIASFATAPFPAGSSLAKAVYERMPNDTDLSVFLDAGVQGIGWAPVDGFPAYHSPNDVAEALSPGTVQHMGEQGLATARALMEHAGDFHAADASGRLRDVLYADVFGRNLVHHPLSWARMLSLLAPLVLVGWWRATRPRAAAVLLGALVAALALAASVGLGFLLPHVAPTAWSLRTSHASRSLHLLLVLASVGLALLPVAPVALLARRRLRVCDPNGGALVLLLVLGAAAAWVLPEGAFLFLWPPLAGILATLASGESAGGVTLRGLALALTASLVLPWVHLLFLALSLGVPVPGMLLATWAGLLLLATATWEPPVRHGDGGQP